MIGHHLMTSWQDRHEVFVTLREDAPAYAALRQFQPDRAYFGVDVSRLQDVVNAIADARPEVVVNAAGIVKQRPSAKETIASLEVNALYPHRLAQVCRASGARLIHLSTDCVFSGRRGRYTEEDAPDPEDLYGRTKLLGEVTEAHCLTLRTSIIGLELHRKVSLVEWFLAQRGTVRGFRRAIYTGLTTREIARAIEHLLVEHRTLSGVWHLSSEPIAKLDLLATLARKLKRTDVEVVADDSLVCDRSLDSAALRRRVAYRVPPWDQMLDELVEQIRERETAQ